jgi:hypothetical protein
MVGVAYAKAVIPSSVEGDHNSMVDDPELSKDFAGRLQDLMVNFEKR